MKTNHKITLDIPDEIFTKICEFRKKSNMPDEKSTIFELIKHALSLSSYFRNFNWDKAEEVADKEIDSGKVKTFSSVDEFMSDLKA